jgi:ferritin-like metal-binding protein YciE
MILIIEKTALSCDCLFVGNKVKERIMNLKSLEDLFTDALKDIYSAETQLVKTLPALAKRASSLSLRKVILTHVEETKGHVERLDKIALALDVKLAGKKCKAMEGLIAEAKDILDSDGADTLIDIAIIGAAQRVEHYEMAAYGCARAIAEELGQDQAAILLQKTLDEEGAADKKLTAISKHEVLPEATKRTGIIPQVRPKRVASAVTM